VDIRHILQLPPPAAEAPNKAVIVQLNQIVAGITVDEIFDVIYVHPTDISPMPTAVHAAHHDYLRGVVSQGSVMSVLDLPPILTSEALVVNEAA
jgi:purine-binding chemotaxis protein CheW